MHRFWAAILGVLCLVGNNMAQDTQALMKANQKWTKAYNEHDAGALIELYTDDAVSVSTKGRKLAGKDAIREGFEEQFSAKPDVKTSNREIKHRYVSDDVAIEEGVWKNESNGKAALSSGEYVVVYSKHDDSWLVEYEAVWQYDEVALAKQWVAYFAGDWTRTSKSWIADSGEASEAVYDWSNVLLAGGNASQSKGSREGFGDYVVNMMVDEVGGGLFEMGVSELGVTWKIQFSHVTAESLSGSITGVLPNGQKAKGTSKIVRVNDDVYEAVAVLKMEDGSTSKFSDRNVRQ